MFLSLFRKKPHFLINNHQLEKLLIIEDYKKETIYGIIGRMEVLLDFLSKHPPLFGLIPFLKTYYYVTRASADKYVLYKHYFSNPGDYQLLDVYFASLYFKPLLNFLRDNQHHSPWQQYFHYCIKKDGIAFLQIMLGINAHINADLYKALIDLDYNHKNDFILVNKILTEVQPEVLKFLAMDHDLVGLSGIAFKDFISTQFETTILRWRIEAWSNASNLNTDKALDYKKILEQTEELALKLINSFTDIYHLKNLPTSIRNVNSLSVKLESMNLAGG